jgi:hypothetical protein
MAHTFGTNSAHASGATDPVTFSFTVDAADTLLVLMIRVVGASDRTGGAPTYAGQTLTQVDIPRKATVGPESSAELWYLLDPPAGTADVSIPNSATQTIWHMAATGRAQSGFTSALDGASGGQGTTANPTPGDIMTTVDGDIGFAIVAAGAATWAPSAQTGTVLNNTDDGPNGTGRQYHLQATAGTVNLGWTFGTADDWGAVGAYFKEVASGAAQRFNYGLLLGVN